MNDESNPQSDFDTGTLPQVSPPPKPPERRLEPVSVPPVSEPDLYAQTLAAPASYDPNAVSSSRQSEYASVPYESAGGTFAAPSGYSPQGVRGPATEASKVSRFGVVRPLAKGGMGQVSVAVDRELDRQVVLKEIQPRYARDPAVASRFLLEAQVTGRLEHPGVVPVYGLNQHPDGTPYYAMRFITGESLQDAIRDFHGKDSDPVRDPHERSLLLRQLLKRFVDICNTIGYAHSREILHRDLKPANVMLGAFGETLVVDWGLAKDISAAARLKPNATAAIPMLATQRIPAAAPEDSAGPTGTSFQPSATPNPIGASGTQTEMGQAMGTPAFMSPEQADGRWDEIGPPADIYSLGATLYAILGGHAPFSGKVEEILSKVRYGASIPLQEMKPGVPLALEAICKKAMALNPEHRHATAMLLGVDVERWLADEPIGCYREPFRLRASRWVKRHRTLVTTSAALVVMAAVGLAIGLIAVNIEKNRTVEAKQQTEIAYAKLGVAHDDLTVEQQHTAAARDRAIRARGEARDALLSLSDEAMTEILTGQQPLTGQQKRFLESILKKYERFVAESPDTAESKLFVAGAWYRAGRLHSRLGNYPLAEEAFQKADDLIASAPAQDDADDKTLLQGEVQLYRGILQLGTGRFDAAKATLQKAGETFNAMVKSDVDGNKPFRAEIWHRLGQADDRLGLAYLRLNQPAEAEAFFRAALQNRQILAQNVTNEPEYQFRLAQSLRQIGLLYHKAGLAADARNSTVQARDILVKLLVDNPTSAPYLVQLADADTLLANIALQRQPGDSATRTADRMPYVGRLANRVPLADLSPKSNPIPANAPTKETPALRHADDSVKAWSRLIAIYPADPGYREQFAQANLNYAAALQVVGRLREATTALSAAERVLQDIATRGTAGGQTAMLLGRIQHSKAVLMRERDELTDAEVSAKAAIDIANGLVKNSPMNLDYENDLVYYTIELATIQLAKQDAKAASATLAPVYDRMLATAKTYPNDRDSFINVRTFARLQASLLADRGQYDQFDRAAKALEALPFPVNDTRFAIACLYGRGAILASYDPNLDGERQQVLASELSESALDKIRDAIANGFTRRDLLEAEQDLSKVRDRLDYPTAANAIRETLPPPREGVKK